MHATAGQQGNALQLKLLQRRFAIQIALLASDRSAGNLIREAQVVQD